MKKNILIFTIMCSMFVTPFAGRNTVSFAMTTFDFEALEKMGNELDALSDLLENFELNNSIAPLTSVVPANPVEESEEDNTFIQTDMMIVASNTYTLGLQKDGRVVSTGLNLSGADAVNDWRGIKMIAAGFNHSVGLKNDGTLITAGSNTLGQCNVSDWKDIVAIAAGASSTIGLKDDGTLVGAGDNYNGELNFSSWKNIVAIASGTNHTVGLKNDGTVVAVGKNCGTILNTSSWHDIVSISAISSDIMGLDKNGKVYSTYANDVSAFKDCVGIATAEMYAAGLKRDGTVVITADDVDVSSWRNIISIAAGTSHIVGLKSDGRVVSVEMQDGWTLGQTKVGSWNLSTSITGVIH